jgi:NAD(P)-dependent dehydrogenase (short-subunit alcohol dehydrogenase family)
MTTPSCIVVTGGNRGIGLEFVRQLLGRGDHVIATTRTGNAATAPDLASLLSASDGKLRVMACDMSLPTSIAAFATAIASNKISGLINNAGVWGDQQNVDDFNPNEAASMYQVNALAPLQLSLALRRQLAESKGKLLHISSGLASIGDNTSGGYYGYRMSKAALNMMSRTLAHDLRGDGIASVVVEPGWVKTAMGGPNAPTDVAPSVKGMLAVYDRIDRAASSTFMSYRGTSVAW